MYDHEEYENEELEGDIEDEYYYCEYREEMVRRDEPFSSYLSREERPCVL